MIIKTTIKEEEPTINGLIYPKGSLQKIKDLVQDRINQKTFFVFPCGCTKREDFADLNNVVGIVNSFEIKDGQGYFDIQFIRDTSVINIIGQDGLRIAIVLEAKVGENNIVELTDMEIYGVKLVVHNELMGD